MGFSIKGIIIASVLLVANAILFILWISGWPASKELDDNNHSSNINSAAAAQFYFSWGFLVHLATIASIIMAFIPPWPLVKKIGSGMLLYMALLTFFLVGLTLAFSSSSLQYADCSKLSGDSEDNCNGGKLIWVTSFFYMLLSAGEIVAGTISLILAFAPQEYI